MKTTSLITDLFDSQAYNILVTGGSGFIGSNFIIDFLNSNPLCNIINFDKLTYAGNPYNLKSLNNNPRYFFVKGDICDSKLIKSLLAEYKPFAIVNFAAETHVDRSIDSASIFMQTNIMGTYCLLAESFEYFNNLQSDNKKKFRFLHVSTDEVYGSLEMTEPSFIEKSSFNPNSPYAASKASSDHLVRAWYQTYSLPVLTTNCSNNYGPYQFPEKLIPLCILNALNGKTLPIYGDGMQIRDWLYVKDHCNAIRVVLERGRVGETYNIGGSNEKTNLEVVYAICDILDELKPRSDGKSYQNQITFVKDRPGHDRRYAIDASKIKRELNWKPKETFETGLRKTVIWYLENQDWVNNAVNGEYQNWIQKQYT